MSEEDKGSPAAPGERMELPTWNRSRTKRRGGGDEGPQDDAFVAGVKEVGRGAKRRGPLVIVGALVLLSAVVVGIVVYSTKQKTAAVATRELATAARAQSEGEVGDPALLLGASKGKPVAPIFKDEAERSAAVGKALDALDTTAPGSDPELVGELVRAASDLRAGKPADAEALYRGFLGRAGAGHPLVFAAREGLAFAREAQGDLDGALTELDALAGEKGVFYRDMALYQKGRILERQGKTEDALAIYRQYLVEYPLQQASLAQNEVRRRLEELDPKALADQPASQPMQVLDGPPGGVP